MMNRCFLLLSSAILTFSSVGALPISSATLEGFKITPLHVDGNLTNMEVSFKITGTLSVKFLVYIVNDLYPDGIVISNLSFTKTTTRQIIYKNEYTRPTNSIRIVWTFSKKTFQALKQIDTISGSSYRISGSDCDYNTSGKIFTYKEASGWVSTVEKLTFTNFNDAYIPDYYHKIDLKEFKIKTSLSFPSILTCSSAYLYVTNYNGAFDDFKQNSGRAEFEISLAKSSSSYYLKFKDDLYVNPETLRMYSTNVPNTVKTSYLYFPVDGRSYEDKYNCYLSINGLGISYSSFLLTFKYKSLLNIFGDCRNSEYCIVNS